MAALCLVLKLQVRLPPLLRRSAVAAYWDAKRKEKERLLKAQKAGEPPRVRRSGGLVPRAITVGKASVLGQGSFGTVFFGTWAGAAAAGSQGAAPQAVVLKRANERVLGAEELLEREMLLNEMALRSDAARSGLARYLGVCEVRCGCCVLSR